MDALTLAELRRLCGRRGLATSGGRSELTQRLAASAPTARAKNAPLRQETPRDYHVTRLFPSDYAALGMPELQDLCRKRSLATGGLKNELVERLRRSDPRLASLEELIGWCRHAGLSTVGTTPELVERVMLGMIDGANRTKQVERRPVVGARPDCVAVQGTVEGPTVPPASVTSEPATTLSLAELKRMCRERKLLVAGSRADLIQRLRQNLAGVSGTGSLITPIRPRTKQLKRKSSAHETEQPTKEAKIQETREPRSISEEAKQSHLFRRVTTRHPAPPKAPLFENQGCYVVVLYDRSPRASTSAPRFRLDRAYTTKDAANARVRSVFYKAHPEDWTPARFEECEQDIRVNYEDELLALSVSWAQSTWTVEAAYVPSLSAASARSVTCYIVGSSLMDRASSPESLKLTLGKSYRTKEGANNEVERVFSQKHPWGVSTLLQIKQDSRDGLDSRSTIIDGVEWCVSVYSVTSGEAKAPGMSSQVDVSLPEITGVRVNAQHKITPATRKLVGHRPHSRAQVTCSIPTITPETVDTIKPCHSNTKSQKTFDRAPTHPTSSKLYLVYGIKRSSETPSNYQFFPPCRTREEANSLVERAFYEKNPWSWTRQDFKGVETNGSGEERVNTRIENGLLELSTCSRRENWTVRAVIIPNRSTLFQNRHSSAIVVFSLSGYEGNVGFHTSDEAIVDVLTVETSVQAANKRVRDLFRLKHPYMSLEELAEAQTGCESGTKIHEIYDCEGLLSTETCPDDSESWRVKAQRVVRFTTTKTKPTVIVLDDDDNDDDAQPSTHGDDGGSTTESDDELHARFAH